MMDMKIDLESIKKMLQGMQKEFTDGPKGAKAGYLSGDKGKIAKADTNPPDVADIALWQEFGTYNIPPRPFIREAQIKANTRCERVVKALLDDGTDMETVTKQIAQLLSEEMKRSIRHGNWAPNAPITVVGGWMRNAKSGKMFFVKGKKSTQPLIDTGNMVQSIHTAIITNNNSETQQD